MEFNNVNELYLRVLPALKIKANEANKLGSYKISEEDIFDFLANSKWKKANDLTLYLVTDDILKCDIRELKEYLRKK